MSLPEVELRTTQYRPDGSTSEIQTDISELERRAMEECFVWSDEALMDGNPPIGAVLIDNDRGLTWGAKTIDKTSPDILGHAEVRAYKEAQATVGDQLQNCTLVSTAQLCTTCIAPYAEGKIGKIIYAAPRSAIWAAARLMRPRAINMHELLLDGDVNTVVTEGFRATDALGKFVAWAGMRDQGRVAA